MSDSFYARYIPPTVQTNVTTTAKSKSVSLLSSNAKKRKKDDAHHNGLKKHKRSHEFIEEVSVPGHSVRSDAVQKPTSDHLERKPEKEEKKKEKKSRSDVEQMEPKTATGASERVENKRKKKDNARKKSSPGQGELEKDTTKLDDDEREPSKLAKGDVDETGRSETNPLEQSAKQLQSVEQLNGDRAPKKRKKRKEDTEEQPTLQVEAGVAEEHSKKHQKLLSKYNKSAKPPAPIEKPTEDDSHHIQTEVSPQPRDLAPIPLPEPDNTYTTADPASALPLWLQRPTVARLDAESSFESLGVSENLLPPLHTSGFDKALPTQAAVLPELLPKASQHLGDLAVSASTGSGKTLAYVLPIIQDLQVHAQVRLRAIIVVPTRELVDQISKVCGIFVEATGLKVGVAVGNRALKLEQGALLEKRQVYDPKGHERYSARLEAIVDVSAESDEGTDDDDELDMGEIYDTLPHHVPKYYSKVDILVSTPGRLVEHIKSTRGFHLHDLRWLVIDEADRLLDQSFQEWADVLNNALPRAPAQSQPDALVDSFDDPYIRGIFADPWPLRPVGPKKVILSATMTRDLEKLALLNLRKPKFVCNELETHNSIDAPPGEQNSGSMSLPPNLEEYAIPVGDGSEKPLYLLKLVELILSREHIQGTGRNASTVSHTPNATKLDDNDPNPDDKDGDEVDTKSKPSPSPSSSSSSSNKASPPPQTPPEPPSSKPLLLIFTSTNESAVRLMTLLSHLSPEHIHPVITSLTKSTSASRTRKLLASLSASNGKKQIVIATDRASRGLDITHLTDIINYDVPRSVVGYIHRVGRTARAGRSGRAWTLLAGREAAWFWHVVARGDEKGDEETIERSKEQKVRKVRLEGVKEGREELYTHALGLLKEEVGGE